MGCVFCVAGSALKVETAGATGRAGDAANFCTNVGDMTVDGMTVGSVGDSVRLAAKLFVEIVSGVVELVSSIPVGTIAIAPDDVD